MPALVASVQNVLRSLCQELLADLFEAEAFCSRIHKPDSVNTEAMARIGRRGHNVARENRSFLEHGDNFARQGRVRGFRVKGRNPLNPLRHTPLKQRVMKRGTSGAKGKYDQQAHQEQHHHHGQEDIFFAVLKKSP